ncbi:hypothetical protein ABIB25_005023 [Nakamurella sp. UYEF19]|uniref:ketopantoate reductase C-terminal domain-containing protein n=1 Tax=Nakamurella sp. UYEF19 TaxID=1756392 RepID=UPI0033991E2B
MWQKWVMLASVGAHNCLMRGSVGDIVAATGGLAFADALPAETAAVATTSGYLLRETGRQLIATWMTTPGSAFSSSRCTAMCRPAYRDVQAGVPRSAGRPA